MYDCIVIGGGVVGTAVLDALSTRGYKTLLIEKEDDVASGASRANSGIAHAGYDCVPGTLKAKFNVEGNKMMPSLTRDLDVPFRKTGSLVLAGRGGEKGEPAFDDRPQSALQPRASGGAEADSGRRDRARAVVPYGIRAFGPRKLDGHAESVVFR